jgi:hypothetical protein
MRSRSERQQMYFLPNFSSSLPRYLHLGKTIPVADPADSASPFPLALAEFFRVRVKVQARKIFFYVQVAEDEMATCISFAGCRLLGRSA